ncbi:unnamed protein product [Symbiodinium pilosum]|uniref:Uncharacterized protein n=1 Tax=Symbiodinium pilosum TaxID=2952 RepID=A0A812X5K4_SYMPI|nr:unnamed protein product [Symbiodinium pilosum]
MVDASRALKAALVIAAIFAVNPVLGLGLFGVAAIAFGAKRDVLRGALVLAAYFAVYPIMGFWLMAVGAVARFFQKEPGKEPQESDKSAKLNDETTYDCEAAQRKYRPMLVQYVLSPGRTHYQSENKA